VDGWISACTIDIFCVSVCDVALMFQFHVVCVCSNGTFRWGRTVALKGTCGAMDGVGLQSGYLLSHA